MPSTAKTQNVQNALYSLGYFTAPSFITIGDQYNRKMETPARYKGKQLVTSPPKKGSFGKGVTFGEFLPLFQDEKYSDQHFHDRQALKEAKKKNITEKPFRFTSPPKKSTGLGDYFGSIGKVFEHMQEYEVKKLVKGEVKPGDKKNIVTNPSRKGTYGFAHIGIGKDFEYKGDPYNAPREKELEDKKKMNAKIVGKGPFKSMAKTLDFFDTQPNVAASKIYTLDKPIPEKAERTSKSPPKTAEKPFKPSSPPKGGFNSTFSKFPEYIGNPYDVKLTPEEAKAAKEKRASKENSKPVWKAVSTIHSSPCRSVIFGSFRGGAGGVNATL